MPKLFEVFDTRFLTILRPDSKLEQIYWGAVWAEGPVYFAEEDYLLFSDIPNNRILRWSPTEGLSTFRQPSNYTNGHYRDHEGRLISCEHGGRRITRTEADGSSTVLVDNYQGKRFNSPNDLVMKSDGTIWFTDPPYGILSNHEGYYSLSEIGGNYTYRFDPASGEVTIVSDDMEKPNGLAFSPDEKVLYIADSAASHNPDAAHHVRAYDVVDGKTLANSRIFAVITPGIPDGLRVDVNGYLYITSWDSIQVYSPGGELLGKIMVPEKIANCTFGGPNKDRLFITASSSVYAINLNTKGVQTP